MIAGLLVTHGTLGEALIAAVEHFLGPQSRLHSVSNQSLSGVEIRARVATHIAALDESDHLVLFADLAGGSCETTCRLLAADHPRCVGLTGVNLPMLLEFCHYRDRLDLAPLVERVVRKGREGVERCPTRDTP
jgi:mannose/fructose-specific phosphotransferase system component IIA